MSLINYRLEIQEENKQIELIKEITFLLDTLSIDKLKEITFLLDILSIDKLK